MGVVQDLEQNLPFSPDSPTKQLICCLFHSIVYKQQGQSAVQYAVYFYPIDFIQLVRMTAEQPV